MKFPKITFIFVLGLIITLGYACGSDDEGGGDGGGSMADDCSVERSYANDIVPILNSTCAIPNCHVNGFANGDFGTYEGLKVTADAGVLRGQISNNVMPPQNSAGPTELTDAQKTTFLCWIDDGALDN